MKRSNLRRMPTPVVPEDPAGLDKVLLAVGRAAVGWVESKAKRHGLNIDLWDGPDGVGAVVVDALKEHHVPNKRLPELLTPRAIAQHAGLVKKKRARRLAG